MKQLALCLLLSLTPSVFIAAEEVPDGKPVKPVQVEQVVKLKDGTAYMHLQGNFPLRTQMAIFAAPGLSRIEGRDLIKKTFASNYKNIVIDCSNGFALSPACAEAYAALIRQKRLPGQNVTCVLDNAGDSHLIVAAACDKTVCIEAGFHNVDGIAMYMDYYADALKKMGVKFHAVTSGPEKTGPEFMTHNKPSEAAIKQAERLLNIIDDNLITQSQRGDLTAEAIKQARALAPQSSEVLKAAGVVHEVVEIGAWQKQLPQPLKRISNKQKQQDLSSFAGMMAFWGQLMSGPRDSKAKAYIAVLELEGSIIDGDGSEPGMITALDTVREIYALEKDDRAKAVLIRINSGGGSATASDRIYHAVKSLAEKKPCMVLIDDVAASGGYYIACAAPYIMAHHGSITGSIGVFGVMPDLTETRKMLGIHRHVLSSSPRATIYDSGAFDEQKKQAIGALIEDIDKRFQGIVAKARKLKATEVAALADGKVYLASEALALGLIDANGHYEDALAHLRKQVEEELPVERFPEPKGLAEMLGLGMQMWMDPDLRLLLRASKQPRPMAFCWRVLPTVD